MNEQKPPASIEWTRIRNPDGSIRRGYTWNPVAGCLHDCEWTIDGKRAECYAKTIAEKFTKAYPDGFASHYYHPERLHEPFGVKEGAGIFCDSMGDLFGSWVAKYQREEVLGVMRGTPQHIYQCLTKNTKGYRDQDLPANMWPGISSPPDHMFGKELHDLSKEAYLKTALATLGRLSLAGSTTWMSFEPLSQDWAGIVATFPGALKWAVIGAASDGRKQYPPEEAHVRALLDVLDAQGVAVFFKGNLKSLAWARDHWRADFPGAVAPKVSPHSEALEQLRLW